MTAEYGALEAAHQVRAAAETLPVQSHQVPTWLAHRVFKGSDALPGEDRVDTVTVTMAVDDCTDTTITPRRAWLCRAERGVRNEYVDFAGVDVVQHVELDFSPGETLPRDWIATAVSANDIRDEPFLTSGK